MPKLLYITTNLQGSGGVARVLSVKLNYLSETLGYDIHVVTTNNKSDTFFYKFSSNIEFHKIDIKNIGFHNLLKYRKKLQSILDKVQANIIINCDNGLKGVLLPYLVKTDALLIFEKHSSWNLKTATHNESLKNRMANFIFDRSTNKYQKIILLNEADKTDYKANNIKVIPNPLCVEWPKEKSTLKNKVALAVGRYSPEKQFDMLLKIWQQVVIDSPDWVLKIYGESDTNDSLKNLTRKLKIENNVKLFPPTKDIAKEYQNASMLLNTSSSEAFGMVLIEAMAYGLPVIAFNEASGPKSLIENNTNGFLINSFDLQAYTNKVQVLIKDEALRKKIGANTCTSVKKYDLNVIMQQWEELFHSMM